MEYKLWKIFHKRSTPIHVFSKNKSFVDGFLEDQFDTGMHIDTSQSTLMWHQGFYSLFQKNLIRSYGSENAKLPEFLDKGLE